MMKYAALLLAVFAILGSEAYVPRKLRDFRRHRSIGRKTVKYRHLSCDKILNMPFLTSSFFGVCKRIKKGDGLWFQKSCCWIVHCCDSGLQHCNSSCWCIRHECWIWFLPDRVSQDCPWGSIPRLRGRSGAICWRCPFHVQGCQGNKVEEGWVELPLLSHQREPFIVFFNISKSFFNITGKYTAILSILVVGSFIIPMAQYFWYVRDDDSSDQFFAKDIPEPPKKGGFFGKK